MNKEKSPLTVRAILNHNNLVSVHEDTPIEELDKILASYRISGVPVVSDQGTLVGTISQTDLIRLISDDLSPGGGSDDKLVLSQAERLARLNSHLKGKKVKDLMERRVHYVAPDEDITGIARMMRRLNIHRVPVVEDGELVGIVTAFDLLQIIENSDFAAQFYTFRKTPDETLK